MVWSHYLLSTSSACLLHLHTYTVKISLLLPYPSVWEAFKMYFLQSLPIYLECVLLLACVLTRIKPTELMVLTSFLQLQSYCSAVSLFCHFGLCPSPNYFLIFGAGVSQMSLDFTTGSNFSLRLRAFLPKWPVCPERAARC